MKKMNVEWITHLQSVLGEEGMLITKADMEPYAHDETEDLVFYPDVVLLPTDTIQVVEIMRFCHTNRIAVTPRGAGTGLSGGALAVEGGVSLSLERMNTILDIDEDNLQATVEPGVITQVFQEAVAAKGLFYPPDPASKGSCFIGGNLAENAGGPKAVKYGVTKDYVLNLEVVLPTGEVIWTGANVLKNSTGYNLTQLIVGSEGTLGVITKAVFRLIPLPKNDLLMLVPFYSAAAACKAVATLFHAGITPSGLEFMERDALLFGIAYAEGIQLDIDERVQAHLLIEVDGNDMEVLYKECEAIHAVLSDYECGEVLFADTAAQKEQLWKLRRSLGEAVKRHSTYKEEDTVVPRAKLPQLLEGVKAIGKEYGFDSVCYGHAGDGNLHVNILKGKMSDDAWVNDLPQGIEKLFKLCVKLGGTISGEHGIGYVQKRYMSVPFSKIELDLQRNIKKVFDPHGIMNPSKVFQ
jgi:glycolate oxidase